MVSERQRRRQRDKEPDQSQENYFAFSREHRQKKERQGRKDKYLHRRPHPSRSIPRLFRTRNHEPLRQRVAGVEENTTIKNHLIPGGHLLGSGKERVASNPSDTQIANDEHSVEKEHSKTPL